MYPTILGNSKVFINIIAYYDNQINCFNSLLAYSKIFFFPPSAGIYFSPVIITGPVWPYKILLNIAGGQDRTQHTYQPYSLLPHIIVINHFMPHFLSETSSIGEAWTVTGALDQSGLEWSANISCGRVVSYRAEFTVLIKSNGGQSLCQTECSYVIVMLVPYQ